MQRLLSATLLAGLLACQSYVATPVQPQTLVAVAQRKKVRVATKADVLLVIDDSFSMSGKQARLAQALANFTQQLDALQPPVDYQAAVVTTSVSERFGACGPAGDPGAAQGCDSEWGASGYTCDPGLACFRSFPAAGVPVQPAGVPAPILRRADYSAAQFAQYLAQSVQVGTAGSRQPQGFEAMKLALARPGLLRDGAKVVVAFFSDAEDCSDPAHRFSALVRDPATGRIIDRCAQESQGTFGGAPALEPVATYAQLLRTLQNADGSAKEVEVAAVVSLQDGSQDPGLCQNAACDAECDAASGGVARCQQQCAGAPTYQVCVSDCLAQCHSFCGGQVPGRRYLELAYAFSGVAANICRDDASGPLGQLSAVIGIPKQVALRTAPSPAETLVVRVERGAQKLECASGTDYQVIQTADGPAVRFLGGCALQPDDVWDIRYLAAK